MFVFLVVPTPRTEDRSRCCSSKIKNQARTDLKTKWKKYVTLSQYNTVEAAVF